MRDRLSAQADEPKPASDEVRRRLAQLVVHDLRSPLSSLTLLIEMLKDTLGERARDADVAEIIEGLDQHSQRALRLCGELLNVEELESGHLVARRENVAVREFVQSEIDLARLRMEARQLDLQLAVSDGLTFRFDPRLLTRVIENLLDNAMRYTPRGGVVRIEAAVDAGTLHLRVANEGPAIPAAARERIFGRYFQLDARREGARAGHGLGLYYCKLAVEAHGGTISADTSPAFPTVFSLVIPDS